MLDTKSKMMTLVEAVANDAAVIALSTPASIIRMLAPAAEAVPAEVANRDIAKLAAQGRTNEVPDVHITIGTNTVNAVRFISIFKVNMTSPDKIMRAIPI